MRALDPDDQRPASQQLTEILRDAIRSGEWSPGEQLPSIKDLAAQYDLATLTVQTALKPLKLEGMVISRPGAGNYLRSAEPLGRDVAEVLKEDFTGWRHGGTVRYVGLTGQPLLALLPTLPRKNKATWEVVTLEVMVREPAARFEEALELRLGVRAKVRVHVSPHTPEWGAVQGSRNDFFFAPDGEDALLNPLRVCDFRGRAEPDTFGRWFQAQIANPTSHS